MGRSCCIALFVIVCLLPALASAAWEMPSHWDQVGAVRDWRYMDSQMYRFSGDMPFLDRSQQNVDQVAAYAESRRYLGRYDAIQLEAFLALSDEEREDRIDATREGRKYVEDFRMRMSNYVQHALSNRSRSWGQGVADVTTLADCLQLLRTTTGLDPANPYGWHLYAYFSNMVGDRVRALRALQGATVALAAVPDGEMMEMRRDVALDQAWLHRTAGRFDEATDALDAAVAAGAGGFDVILLRGLIAAQTGSTQAAVEIAAKLSSVEILRYPHNIRSTSFSPEIANMKAWKRVNSGYARSWILALVWLEQGDADMAAGAFGEYRTEDAYPQAWRFWQDAGLIYDMTGRGRMAQKAWVSARIWRPYSPYFPVKVYEADIGRFTGRPGQQVVFMGFDQFLIAGSPLALGMVLAQEVDHSPDDPEAQAAAARALDVLEECADTGTYPAQAHLLRGAVYHRMGDLQSAVLEVREALAIVEKSGDGPGHQAIMREVAQVADDKSDAEIQAFFGQSGSLQSRWSSPADPEAEEARLRAEFAANGSAANRQGLARFLIRYGDPVEGRELVTESNMTGPVDLQLALEADRSLGNADLAQALVERLENGTATDIVDAETWVLAGFICLDHGHQEPGRKALKRALELDPGNHGLQIQLRMLEEG